MPEALNRAQKALDDARSSGTQAEMSAAAIPVFYEEPLDSPLDKETLDERASSQMGGWDERRRPTYEGD